MNPLNYAKSLFSSRQTRNRRPRSWRQSAEKILVAAVESLEERCLLSATLSGEGQSVLEAMDFGSLTVDTEQYDASRILVRFRDEQPSAKAIYERSELGRSLSLVSGLFEVTLEEGGNVKEALAAYRAHSSVIYAEPDYRVQIQQLIPNDPRFGELWGLNNTGQTGGTPDADVDAPEAWEAFSQTAGEPIIVAVIDTGIDYTHPDLVHRIWVNPGEIAGNGIDDDGNGFIDDLFGYDFANGDSDPFDDNQHGTHVSGTIAAEFNNGLGVTGVAGPANVQLMALKFLSASGTGSTSDAIEAINYAVDQGAHLSNNSWGGGGFSQALFDAISDARDAGHIFVAAAGNGGFDQVGDDNDVTPHYPSNYNLDNIISVAATNHNDQLASFSNYGVSSVDLGAPGVGVLSTIPGGGYASFSGTSMATPHVAGTVALVWAQNPGWSYTQVIDKILQSVDPVDALAGRTATGGRLNAAQALGPDVSGPRVISSTPKGAVGGSVGTIQVVFNEPIDASTFTLADIVSFTDPDGLDLTQDPNLSLSGSGTTYTITFTSQSKKGDYLMVLGPEILDLAETPNTMDQDGDGNQGEIPDDQYTVAFTISDSFTFVSTDVPAPIQDGTITISYLDITEDVTISDLRVTVDVTHTWIGDVEAYLVRPGADPFSDPSALHPLVVQQGGSSDFLQVTFDDEASQPIGSVIPMIGTFRPESPLAAFDGLSTLGTWELWLYDAYFSDQGMLHAWSMTVLPEGSPPPPSPPTANAGGAYNGDEGSTIVLDGSGSSDSDGTIVSYAWDLDNNGSYETTGQTVNFTRTDSGSYTVGLQVTDDDGLTAAAIATVTIANVAPTAEAGGPYSVTVGNSVTLDASGSSDPGNDIATYEWDLDNDGQYDDAAGVTVDFFAETEGEVTVGLRVTDDDGATHTDTATITVNPVPPPPITPTANAGGPYSGDEGSTIVLDGSGSSDSDGSIVSYAWDLDNDGFYDDATGQTVNFTRTNDGTYTVGLQVTDDDALTATDTATVTVANVAPTAEAGGPYSVTVGSTVTLDASGSSDPGNDIATYEWDLDGDGLYDDATGVTVDFFAETEGEVTVGLLVTDDYGAMDTDTAIITVNAPPPPPPPASGIYVWDIYVEVRTRGRGGSLTDLRLGAIVRNDSDGDGIAEAEDAVLADASVILELSVRNGPSINTYQGITGGNGEFRTGWITNLAGATYLIEVTGLSHATLVWNQTLDPTSNDGDDDADGFPDEIVVVGSGGAALSTSITADSQSGNLAISGSDQLTDGSRWNLPPTVKKPTNSDVEESLITELDDDSSSPDGPRAIAGEERTAMDQLFEEFGWTLAELI